MATRKRAPSRNTTGTRTRRRTGGGIASQFTPDVVRSIIGITLLILGAMTLIALLLPGKGTLTSWWTDVFAPWFGAMRWLLPFLLLAAGGYLEWRRPKGWGLTLLGIGLMYAGVLGIGQVLVGSSTFAAGGRIGRFFEGLLEPLLTAPGAIVVLLAMVVVGLMLAFNLHLDQIMRPFVTAGAWSKTTAADALKRPPTTDAKPAAKAAATKAAVAVPIKPASGDPAVPSILDAPPAPAISSAPVSRTFWTGEGAAPLPAAGAVAVATRPSSADADDEPADGLASIDWVLPSIELLEPARPSTGNAGVDHEANIRRIEEKLRHFAIPAKVVGQNSGPVVTQYEVRPDKGVKLSRIEALSDDLAMALAARSIRIEAPIPGKDLVGIEIPNQVSEVVAFRPLVEDSNMLAASQLTFALGRDVSGEAKVVDLAKMPHLLIAGATGSGKSVCVNAVITSLLMHARPDEVRLILVDLKRVELAPYDGLPHLLQHVIVEANEAKAILNWAVHEMEDRYKALASRTVRNIEAYNALPEDVRGERLPYIVLIIDELADLIMREGRKVEDPVVKIAQKARAVGIHLVLATQRPSVNVVTGLIKANVPSRIAFAMASMVDSRTVLDSPGAEDLIGRGDMLYQPVDLPRPMRLQGVFVTDAEVNAVTHHWLAQSDGRTFYEEAILEFSDGEGNGNGEFAWLAALDVDDMTPHAAELIMREQKASTSRLQTKLKLGFSRASRVMDELERYGIVGPRDRAIRPPRASSTGRRTGFAPPTTSTGTIEGAGSPSAGPPGRLGYADRPEADPDGRLASDADGPPMTTQDRTRRTTSGDRPDAPKPGPDATTSLPERLYEARERKGVDLYRAERDTKIRARYLDAMERGDWKELPGAVYTKGFLRNYALYLGLDADEVLEQWRRERGESREAPATLSVPRPLAAPRQGLTFSPFIIVLALMTIGVLAFGAYLGVQLLRFAKPPTISVTDPATAVVDVDDSATSYTLRGVTLPSATVNIDDGTPDRDPYQVTAELTGLWSATVDLRRGRNQFDVNAIDPETGKHSEDTIRLYITVPFPTVEAPTLSVDQPAEGATYENGAIPVQGMTTNATSVVITAAYSGPVTPTGAGKPTPAPPKAPAPKPAPIADDGTFSTPLELTAGHWAITITASSAEGKKTALTRNVTVAYQGVNVVVSVQGSRAWLKVWVDGKVSDLTGAAGRVYAPGKVLTFNAEHSVEVRTGKSSATYFTVNGIDLGHMSDQGNPETWLFAPPDDPKQTDRR